MKLNTSSHYETGHCWKGFQGQRSRVKVIARPNALLQQRHTFPWCGLEDHLFSTEKHYHYQAPSDSFDL